MVICNGNTDPESTWFHFHPLPFWLWQVLYYSTAMGIQALLSERSAFRYLLALLYLAFSLIPKMGLINYTFIIIWYLWWLNEIKYVKYLALSMLYQWLVLVFLLFLLSLPVSLLLLIYWPAQIKVIFFLHLNFCHYSIWMTHKNPSFFSNSLHWSYPWPWNHWILLHNWNP